MSSQSSGFTISNPITPPADLVTQGILDQISNVALNYAQQVYNWGQTALANVQQVTADSIAALTQAASTAMSGATESMNQYTNSFLPDYNSLRTEAASYASPGRESRDAGMAASDQMQAGNSARMAAEQNLQSMGIDPSSGRYADLENAQRTATAAAAAGAGTQAIRADETTGIGLQKEALDYGIQLPGIAANFLNQANQGTIGAENAALGAANTGVAINQLPNAFLGTAMANKYPPSANQTTSRNQSTSQPKQPGSPTSGQQQQAAPGGAGTQTGANPAGSGIADVNNPFDTGGTDQWGGTTGFNDQTGMSSNMDTLNTPITSGGVTDPQAGSYGGYNTAPDISGTDPSASYNDPTASSYGTDPSSYYDTSGGSGSFDSSASTDNSYQPSDYSGGDSSVDYGGDYATGGAIPDDATTGGQVPVQASPSAGAQTDDVHASLNADEFVIPRDVALWKGQEFFQKLIAQSRKNRVTAPAHGKPAAAPSGPVNFASQPTG